MQQVELPRVGDRALTLERDWADFFGLHRQAGQTPAYAFASAWSEAPPPFKASLSIAAELQSVLTRAAAVVLREIAPTSRARESDFAASAE